MDVRENTTLRDGDAAEQLVELLVVPDRELEVARVDPGLLVVPGRVPGELEDLGREVLEDRREVHRSAGADPLAVRAGLEVPVDPADRELEPGARRARLGLALGLSALSTTRHDEGVEGCCTPRVL